MNLKVVINGKFFRPACGAALTIACGLLLWGTDLGNPWTNASYDYLFLFSNRAVTNGVVLVQMDNDAFDSFYQLSPQIPADQQLHLRQQLWDRSWHAQLLNRLADGGCRFVVFDVLFQTLRDPAKDAALAAAMRRQPVVLMADQGELTHPTIRGVRPIYPNELFLSAAGGHWGVAGLTPDMDSIVRHYWPFPDTEPGYQTLARTAARLAGAKLEGIPEERWLRYYDASTSWERIGYRLALQQTPDFFKNKIVFIGTQPATSAASVAGDEKDEFLTPFSRWTGKTTGGVEIMITSFLNLVNGDWLLRPSGTVEACLFVIFGLALGLGSCRFGLFVSSIVATVIALFISWGAISVSYYTSYWFPWVIVLGGQLPCALAWSAATRKSRAAQWALEPAAARHPLPSVEVKPPGPPHSPDELPDVPDYELMQPPFGRGSYGKVWLVRNAVGQWQALKAVYLANFSEDADPYEREFNGIKKYKPISDQHPGLLRVDFVSKKKEAGYFYYVMELGDPLEPGWENEPSTYRPRDLSSERSRSHGRKLPARECLRIGIALADALDFLHRQGLTHRDIKPQNIIFVNGQPKLADVGLISEIRPPDRIGTLVGTPGYMPPAPESPGTPQADIYALGMVLYVLSTGRGPGFFPEISTTLVGSTHLADFFPLNAVLLKACHPDRSERYATAAELCRALREARQSLENPSGANPPPPEFA